MSVSAANGGTVTGSRTISGNISGIPVNLTISSATSQLGGRSVTGTVGGVAVNIQVSSATTATGERTVSGTDPTGIAPVIAALSGNGIFW